LEDKDRKFKLYKQTGEYFSVAINYQHTALKSAEEGWWDTKDKILYRGKPIDGIVKKHALIRKYNCPQYDPSVNTTGTGIVDQITLNNITSSFDVINIKPENDPEKAPNQCYDKGSMESLLKFNESTDPKWPHSNLPMSPKDFETISKIVGIIQKPTPIIPPGSIKCSGKLFRVVLNPSKFVEGIFTATNGWGIKLPKSHYSAGYTRRMTDGFGQAGWSFDTAEDIPVNMLPEWEKDLRSSNYIRV